MTDSRVSSVPIVFRTDTEFRVREELTDVKADRLRIELPRFQDAGSDFRLRTGNPERIDFYSHVRSLRRSASFLRSLNGRQI